MTAVLETPVATAAPVRMPAITRMAGVGTAVSGASISQSELIDLMEIDDPRTRSIFLNSAIDRRHLTLPEPDATGRRQSEPQGELLDKHKRLAVEMGTCGSPGQAGRGCPARSSSAAGGSTGASRRRRCWSTRWWNLPDWTPQPSGRWRC